MIPLWYQTHNQDGTSFFPLAYYIKRMQIGRYFTRPCWGDGELRLMLDETRLVKIRGGKLRPELLEAFLESIAYVDECKDDMLLASISRRLSNAYFTLKTEGNETGQEVFNLIEKVGLKNYKWHDAFLFRNEILEGKFYPFIEQINKMHLVIVAPEPNRILKEKGIDYDHWIDVPQEGNHYAIEHKEFLLEKCLEHGKPGVYLLCCGDGSAWLATKLHKKISDSFIYDFGKGLDYLSGWKYWGVDVANTKDPVEKERKRQELYKIIESNLRKEDYKDEVR